MSRVWVSLLSLSARSAHGVHPQDSGLPTGAALPAAEIQALSDLFWATNGPAWTNNFGWISLQSTTTTNPCGDGTESTNKAWFGVTCAENHVVNISLASNNVAGTVPPSISNFKFLVQIALNLNSIQGTLPSSICELGRLETADMQINQLAGTLPSCFNRMTSLKRLLLEENSIGGTLPESLCDAKAIRFIELDENRFKGSIPACLGELQALEHLELDDNMLTGSISGG